MYWLALALLASPRVLQDPGTAQWIWGGWAAAQPRPQGERVWLRRRVTLPAAPRSAVAFASGDNHFTLWVNGQRAGHGDSWTSPTRLQLAPLLHAGDNQLAVEASNDGAEAALLLFADLELADGSRMRLQTDSAWRGAPAAGAGWTEPGFDDSAWAPAAQFGPYGTSPWTGLTWSHEVQFQPLPGFTVELVADGLGSLINLALDARGRVLVSAEGGGVARLSDADGDGSFESAETYTDALRYCQGLCWSRGSLYAVGEGPQGTGLYRVDERRPPQFLGGFAGAGGEHGAHGVVEGPDGDLYLAVGNHVQIATPPSADSPYRFWYEGTLLPPYYDPRGHAVDIRAPGGTVVRVDHEGKRWSLVAGGFRNQYDLAFNARGDLFTYDSDMEWDVGLPWYRPVRVLQVIPGGEYGWRTSSYNWPSWYVDSLPPAIEVGRGSPTGIAFYEGTQFPARFRGALLGCDWSQGLIYAFHLQRGGYAYSGSAEVLLRGQPMPVTDVAVCGDGSVLFCTGGRGTYGALYRLRYTGAPEPAAPPDPLALLGPQLCAPDAPLEQLVAALKGLLVPPPDRFERFAAMRGLARGTPVPAVLSQLAGDVRAQGDYGVAMAQHFLEQGAGPGFQVLLAACSANLDAAKDEEARLSVLRALELLLMNPAAPDPALRAELAGRLMRMFPSGQRRADREMAILLAFLHPDGALEALLAQMETHPSHEEQIHYAYCARAIHAGWSGAQKLRYLRWTEAALSWPGGFSFQGYILDMQQEVEALLEPPERAAWEREKSSAASAPALVLTGGASHDYDTTLAFLQRAGRAPRRDPAEGARVFSERCAACHAYGGLGRGVGPDLGTLRARFSTAEILESVLSPSRVISDQYRAQDIWTRDGAVRTALVLREDGERLQLLLGDGNQASLPLAEVKERGPSQLSLMPTGLLDGLTLEQIADLLALFDVPQPPPVPAASPWRSLFDGKTLDGWVGDPALWSVQDGVLVGRADGRPASSFLISRERYGDFRLEYDLLLEEGNSGLQFRAEQVADFVLHGYQADAGQTYWGSLYEEGGRGMLAQVPTEVWQPVLNERGWNHYVVEATGDLLRIELNGQTTVELHDGAAAAGLLGFQLHAGGRTVVRIRNIRLRPLG